jgi:hypothetical protein
MIPAHTAKHYGDMPIVGLDIEAISSGNIAILRFGADE